MRVVLLFLSVLFLVSCSLTPPPRQIKILPIVLGYYPEYENDLRNNDILSLYMANTIFKSLNVRFYWDKIYYTDEYISIDQCDLYDALFIQLIDLKEISTKEQRIVVFLEHENQCRNLLGCGAYKGILQKESRVWVYTYNEPFSDGSVIAHELAHVLGAGHVFDGSLMSPSQSMTTDWSFSKETEEQILDTLDETDI